MTSLARRLARRIARQGPISVADYMVQVLTDPEQGYYMTGDPLGRRGDFITAPEVSQVFGELLGLWCAEAWRVMGAPGRVILAEAGPGRGTLMADALRAARMVPDFAAALEVHLVEVSPALRARQEEALGAGVATWHADLGSLPEGPLLLVANEFFDALPIRQFQRTPDGWCERVVGLDDGGALAFGLAPPSPANVFLLPEALSGAPVGGLVEISPAGQAAAAELGRRVSGHGGAALVVDYGHSESTLGNSLQAVRHHARHEVLESPGSADISARVDFAALAGAARGSGARCLGPVIQGEFLERLGIGPRTEALLRQATPDQARQIEDARVRLTAPGRMGALFKVLAIAHPELPDLAGFQ